MKAIIMRDSDPFTRLANAIVYQAVEEYRDVLRKRTKLHKRHMAPDKKKKEMKNLLADQESLERFFHSKWYGTLTSVDPDVILNAVHEEVGI